MQGEYAATSGYHSANTAVGQTEYQMDEATIGALANLATATASDRGMVAALTQPMPILSSSSRTTQKSCGNSKLESRRNELKSVAKAVSTLLPAIIAGRMDIKLVTLTRVSRVNSLNQTTKRRQLEWITWVEVRPTRNDIQGRQL
jgi:hypothetical protein